MAGSSAAVLGCSNTSSGFTQSDHDSPNALTTARSVYVIAHPAARPPRLATRVWGGAVAPCDRDMRNRDTAACCCVGGLLRPTVTDQRRWTPRGPPITGPRVSAYGPIQLVS